MSTDYDNHPDEPDRLPPTLGITEFSEGAGLTKQPASSPAPSLPPPKPCSDGASPPTQANQAIPQSSGSNSHRQKSGAGWIDGGFEHYDILRHPDGRFWELGRGAMGVTYKAFDTRLHCHVALKVIQGEMLTKHPALRERFLREARGAARLRHPNVASVFHLGENAARGECFYAMEFIEGETLESRVRRRGPMPVALALEICTQVARALGAASQQGIVHRDLKPANLMLTADPDASDEALLRASDDGGSGSGGTLVKVIDFGLVKATTDAGDLTAFGGFIGTPQFASPEQIASGADAPGPLDARSDIYSLGVTLWYLLVGKVPFLGRSLAELHDRKANQPLPLQQLVEARVPEPVGELLASMLAFDPGDRPPTPQALAEALRGCHDALPAAPPVASGWSPAVAARSRRWARRRSVFLAAGAILLIALLAVVAWDKLGSRPVVSPRPAPAPTVPEKSIAVLPFDNLSADKENAFFADGVQDDVLTSLSKIGELKVISRGSVAAYREPEARTNLAKIGQTLGVAHLVEGNVRRAGSRIVISVQLIDAASGRQLWGEKYDRTLSDALSLQGEVASEIAGKLRTSLSPAERASVVSKPTENTDAYVLYMRARDVLARASFVRADYESAAKLFEEAVALDPNFALAHARLSQTRSQIAHFFEPTAALQTAARVSAEMALNLRPELGEAHLAMALWLYWSEHDLTRAREQFAVAARALPNDADVVAHLAAIQRHQGNWAESTARFEQAMALNPRNPDIPYELAINYAATGDWPAAARTADRAVALAPDALLLKLWRGDLLFHWKGDYTMLKAALAEMPASAEPDEVTTNLRYQVAMTERNDAAAEAALAACPAKVFTIFDYGAPRPVDYFHGLIRLAHNDRAGAEKFLQAARPVCEAAVREAPMDAYRHAQLGLVYAALGWRDAALGEGSEAAILLSEEKDASDGTVITARRAQIHATLGDAEGALPLLEHLLKTPSPELLTAQDLRLRPEWDAVRGNARFKKLLLMSQGKN